MTNKIITVDFDGVIIEKIWGRDWKMQSKDKGVKKNWWLGIYVWFDRWWAKINHQWRKPIEGSREGLGKLKREGWKIIMVTSRKGYIREITIKWLKKWKLFDFYDDLYFNENMTGSIQSKVDNIGKIRPEIHIDDNRETILELAKKYPVLKLFYLQNDNHELKIENNNIIRICEWKKLWGRMKLSYQTN